MYFHRTPGYWIRMLDFLPFLSRLQATGPHHIRELYATSEAACRNCWTGFEKLVLLVVFAMKLPQSNKGDLLGFPFHHILMQMRLLR